MSRNLGRILFYILLGVVPIAFWLVGEGQQLLFTSFFSSLTVVGKVAGILGICFFAGNLILSGRYHFIDRLFGGLDRAFLFHRKTGIDTFILLTLHIAALTGRYWQFSFDAMIQFLINLGNTPVNYGRLAYGGLFILIILTVFFSRKFKYEHIKFLHSFMGAFLFLGGVHAFLIPSDIASNLYLRWYVLGVATIALASYVVRTLCKRFLVPRIRLDVVAVRPLLGNVTEVVMKPKEKILFLPGQFVFVRFKQKGFPYEDHPFSITASTREDVLRISAKAVGDFTRRLPELLPGATAHVQGPYGGFSFFKVGGRRQVWIAGGIGVTPFMSMARTLQEQSVDDPLLQKYDIVFFYSIQTAADAVYVEELQNIAAQLPNVALHVWVTESDGYLTAEKISRMENVTDRDVLMCGPQPMMDALMGQFVSLGVPPKKIHFEKFKLL